MKIRYLIRQISLIPFHIIGTFGYIISYFWPKDKYLWIYGAWVGERYCDNAKYFFNYMLEYHPEIKSVWITRNSTVYEYLKSKGIRVYYSSSFRGIYLHLTAKIAVLNNGRYDINQNFISRRTRLVQLWHGIPLKKIGYDTEIGIIYDRYIKYLFFLPVLRDLIRFDMVISTSEVMTHRLKSAFRLFESQLPVTGYPRTDIFFNELKSRENDKKIILYAPTHRNEGLNNKLPTVLSEDNLNIINSYMKKNDLIFYIKLHHLEEKFLKSCEYSNIILLKNDPLFDMQEFLLLADVLVTDYSSIFFDYLLLNRPIIFFAYDLEDYIKNDRELYEDYKSVATGLICKSWDEVISALEISLKDPQKYESKRNELKNKIWKYFDTKSSERVYNFINESINKWK